MKDQLSRQRSRVRVSSSPPFLLDLETFRLSPSFHDYVFNRQQFAADVGGASDLIREFLLDNTEINVLVNGRRYEGFRDDGSFEKAVELAFIAALKRPEVAK